MRILIIMDPGISIPVAGYGGHERLVEMFAKEYQMQGHEVELLVTTGSHVPGCVVHGLGKVGFPPRRRDALKAIFIAWDFLRKNHRRYDLIHNFGRLFYLLPVLNKPLRKIMTYGREITGRNTNVLLSLPHQNIVFTGCSKNLISRAQATGRWVAVYNAIDFAKYELTNVGEEAPFIFLGRIEKVKGCHTAIAVAKATNNRLIIAGNISPLPEEKAYFENEIEPHIDGKQIVYAGAVNDLQKNELLGKSKALLFPIEWNEPFGIVMIEAMACGTPVIAYDTGSVDEVIEENITGLKVKDKQGMIEAIKKLSAISRKKCRERAEERFSVHKIASQYLELAAQMTKDKKIVLITTTQPAINPRLVKEANTLVENGYAVTVLYSHKIGWADAADKKIIQDSNWKAILVGGSPESEHIIFFYTRIRHRIYSWLNELWFQNASIAEKTQDRCYYEKLHIAKKINATFYIGHNLGALAIAVNAALYNDSKSGFDFEDYHRHEYEIDNTRRTERIIYLEEKYVPKVDYLSFSSEQIQKQILQDFPGFKKPNTVLLNCFTEKVLAEKITTHGKELKLLWFSQTVGPNRGLECLFEALLLLNDKNISLTIAGRLRDDVKELFPSIAKKIAGEVSFLGVLPPHALHKLAEQHDLGLALEPGISMNNDLALSNKIFTYLLAGNAIIFSETTAQNFFNNDTKAGISFMPGDVKGLAACIRYYKNELVLQKQKEYNLKLAKTKFNWELESRKLLGIITRCTNS